MNSAFRFSGEQCSNANAKDTTCIRKSKHDGSNAAFRNDFKALVAEKDNGRAI